MNTNKDYKNDYERIKLDYINLIKIYGMKHNNIFSQKGGCGDSNPDTTDDTNGTCGGRRY